MFQRLIRVILSAEVDRFVSGMHRAQSALGSLLKAAAGAGIGLAAAFLALPGIINGLINSVQGLIDKMISLGKSILEPAMKAQNFQAIMKNVAGSAEQAAEMFKHLEDESLRTGVAMTDLLQGGQQMAVMLKGMKGSVPIDEWERWVSVLMRFHALRPDVPIEFMARALSALQAGDPSQLTRVLDADINKIIETMGPQFAGFLKDAEGAGEAQLGAVTRLGEGAEQSAGDGLALAEALANQMGATEQSVIDMANTFEGQVNRLIAHWDKFKRILGTPILDVLNDALDRFFGLLEANQPAIDAFALSLGEWAAVNIDNLVDFLFDTDWGKVASDIKDTADAIAGFFMDEETVKLIGEIGKELENIGKLSFEAVQKFVDDVDWDQVAEAINDISDGVKEFANAKLEDIKSFLQDTDWKAIGEAAGHIADVVNAIASGNMDFQLFEKPESFAGQTAVATANAGVGALEVANGNMTPQEAVNKWIAENLSNFPGWAGASQPAPIHGTAGSPGVAPSMDVNVTVTVDEAGQLRVVQIAREQAVNALGEFVGAKTGGGGRTLGPSRINST